VRNAARFSNVHLIRAALWSHPAPLALQNPGASNWSFRFVESKEAGIPSVTVEDIMARLGVDRIDILKLDVEGAEKEIFEHSAGWIDRLGTILIELHDQYTPGCTEALEQAIAGRNFHRSLASDKLILQGL